MKCFAVLLCLVWACQAVERLVKLDTNTYKDAVCLDGTPGAYYIRNTNPEKGWIIYLMGGAWCFGKADCSLRKYAHHRAILGTSSCLPEEANHSGILSDDENENPYFASWNAVFIIYCDGFSFAGNKKEPVADSFGKKMYLRGLSILKGVLQDLVENQRMSNTNEIILTGCSAGGLAALIHADRVRDELTALMKKRFRYSVLADGGYFLDVPFFGLTGGNKHRFRNLMKSGGDYHQAELDKTCMEAIGKSDEDKWKCLFAKFSFEYIESPIFVVNSLYDTVQLTSIRGLLHLPPYHPLWDFGKREAFDAFKQEFLNQATPVISSDSQSVGYFLDSCLDHCKTLNSSLWSNYDSIANNIVVQGQTADETFASWYFDFADAYGLPGPPLPRVVDQDAWPNNPVCGKREFPYF